MSCSGGTTSPGQRNRMPIPVQQKEKNKRTIETHFAKVANEANLSETRHWFTPVEHLYTVNMFLPVGKILVVNHVPGDCFDGATLALRRS